MNDRSIELPRTTLTDDDLDAVKGGAAVSGAAGSLRDAASGPTVLPGQEVHGYLQSVVYRPDS
jgi:hypothetical protein